MKYGEKMMQDMALRNYCQRTISSYVYLTGRFFEWVQKLPAEVTRDDARGYLLYLVNEAGVSPSTYGTVRAALKFFFEVTLGKPCVIERILAPKRRYRLPDVLSLEEALELLRHVETYRNRVALTVMYGCGLRIGEVCTLRVEDIDSARMLIHIRAGKGGKDRFVILPKKVLEMLRAYWKMARPDGYFFPGKIKGTHITAPAVRKAFHNACKRAGITKQLTPHSLRHSFATYLLDTGTELDVVKELLGHESIRTTSIYTRVSTKRLQSVVSPVDAAPNDTTDGPAPVPVH
jgi:site-specific recombinase XerD